MKLSTKLALISSLGCVAAVGTGFAAWTFAGNASGSATANVVVTDATAEDGDLTLGTFYLCFDQAAPKWTSDSVGATDITSTTLTYTPANGNSTGEKINIEVTYVADAAIATYLTINNDASLSAAFVTTAGATPQSLTYTLPTLSYKDGQKPDSMAKYNTMKTALTSAKVTFTLSGTKA